MDCLIILTRHISALLMILPFWTTFSHSYAIVSTEADNIRIGLNNNSRVDDASIVEKKHKPTRSFVYYDDVTKPNDDTAYAIKSRSRRFAYEDLHEWPDDDSLDYYLDDEISEEDLSLADRIGKHWQTVAVWGLVYLMGLCMLILIGCCCCKVCCRVMCHSLRQNCVPCGGFLNLITAYYEDPMYKRAKDMAALFGLKLDYATYLKIKERYDMGAEGPYNPLGLPHMG